MAHRLNRIRHIPFSIIIYPSHIRRKSKVENVLPMRLVVVSDPEDLQKYRHPKFAKAQTPLQNMILYTPHLVEMNDGADETSWLWRIGRFDLC